VSVVLAAWVTDNIQLLKDPDSFWPTVLMQMEADAVLNVEDVVLTRYRIFGTTSLNTMGDCCSRCIGQWSLTASDSFWPTVLMQMEADAVLNVEDVVLTRNRIFGTTSLDTIDGYWLGISMQLSKAFPGLGRSKIPTGRIPNLYIAGGAPSPRVILKTADAISSVPALQIVMAYSTSNKPKWSSTFLSPSV
jgi:hypothetical protein